MAEIREGISPMGFERLPPWDALAWFDLPKQTDVTVSNAPTELVPADPRRVVLVILQPTSAGSFVGLSPSLNGQNGHALDITQGPIVLTHEQHGPLVQCQWFAYSNTLGAVISVLQVLMRGWPQGDLAKAASDAQQTPSTVHGGGGRK